MIAKLRKYFQVRQQRYQMLQETREILWALDQPAATDADRDVLAMLMNIGLAHPRALKKSHDIAAAAREMDLRIHQGPRPSYQDAGLN